MTLRFHHGGGLVGFENTVNTDFTCYRSAEARKKNLDKARKPFKGEIKSAPSSLGKRKLSEAPEPAPKKQVLKKKMKQPKLSSFLKKF